MLRDDRGFNCIDYARLSGDQDVVNTLAEIQHKKTTLGDYPDDTKYGQGATHIVL